MQKSPEVRPLPGVVASIVAGLELTTSHLWLILLPVLLDLFLWLGPRLSAGRLVEQQMNLPGMREALGPLADQMVQLAPHMNLFTALSLPLIGVPAVMSGPSPALTPVQTQVVEITTVNQWLLLFVGLSLAGLLLTAAYFSLLARTVRDGRASLGEFWASLGPTWLRLLGLAVAYLFCLLLVYLPLLPVAAVMSLFNRNLFGAVLLGGVFMLVWVTIYLSFSLPAVLLGGRPVGPALLESIRLVRQYTLPAVSLLFLVVALGGALNWLWRLVDNGSWLTLASILGHGFISTALAAAVFIFYRDHTQNQ
ncbi:MAG: hypothetical protein AB1791_11150 [Chloroflexota bacterium]